MTKKNVQIEYILIKRNAGLEVKYSHEYKGIPVMSKDHIRAEPAKELVSALKKLVVYATKIGPLGHFEHALDSDTMATLIATADLAEVKKKAMNYVNRAVTMRRLDLKYNEEGLRGVIMTVEFNSHQDENMVIKMPMVDLTQTVYGIEDGLQKNTEKVLEQTLAFMDGNFSKIEPEPVEDWQKVDKKAEAALHIEMEPEPDEENNALEMEIENL